MDSKISGAGQTAIQHSPNGVGSGKPATKDTPIQLGFKPGAMNTVYSSLVLTEFRQHSDIPTDKLPDNFTGNETVAVMKHLKAAAKLLDKVEESIHQAHQRDFESEQRTRIMAEALREAAS